MDKKFFVFCFFKRLKFYNRNITRYYNSHCQRYNFFISMVTSTCCIYVRRWRHCNSTEINTRVQVGQNTYRSLQFFLEYLLPRVNALFMQRFLYFMRGKKLKYNHIFPFTFYYLHIFHTKQIFLLFHLNINRIINDNIFWTEI